MWKINLMPRPVDQVILSEMADRLNTQFERYLDEPIPQTTPYDWWKRTKLGTISEPLPIPIAKLGRSPVFRYGDIVRWFISYKGIARMVTVKLMTEE